MASLALTSAYRLLEEATGALSAVVGPGTSDEELQSVLTLCAGVTRRLDRLSVSSMSCCNGAARSPIADIATRPPP
jgi:hypothetical protein